MARFRAPSYAEDSIAEGDVEPTQQPHAASTSTAPAPASKRERRLRSKKPTAVRHVDSVRLMNQYKSAAKKQKVQALVVDREWSYIFVGNLDPTATENDISEVFACCGIIERITIRASRGAAVTKYLAQQNPSSRDRCYATVEFKRNGAAKTALSLDGTKIRGTSIVVCLSPADLPEVKDIMNNHGWIKSLARGKRRIRPLALEPTELIEPTLDTPVHRDQNHRVNWFKYGMSFPKALA